jgi:Predicted membrane protein
MSICPLCGATVEENASVCSSCNTPINASQVQTSGRTAELNARLEKTLRRTELLSYAAAGLGLAIFAVIIIISFL